MKKIADVHLCAKGIHQPKTITVYYNNSTLITTSCRICGKQLGSIVFSTPETSFANAKISP